MTTLGDLEKAIGAIPPRPAPVAGSNAAWVEYAFLSASAWRAAFEWRDQIPAGGATSEYLEGMTLIREKLK